jgi:PAS domain S-box-containing protein
MKKEHKSEAALLRQKAEELMKNKSSKSGKQLSAIETQKLIHELEVHQIELEMQNEELIQANEQVSIFADKYIELYDFAASGYFTLSIKGEIFQLNLTGARMLGRDRAQLKGRLFPIYVSDDSKTIFRLFLEKVFNTKTIETCEIKLNNDRNFPLYLNLSGIVHDNDKQCFITAIDISRQKEIENEVFEEQNLSRKYLEIASVMMCALNSTGEITRINRKGLDILGYKEEEELLGKNWFDVSLPKNIVAEVKGVFAQIMTGIIEPVEYYENPVLTKNGEERIIAFHNSTLQDKENNLSGVLFSGEDITDRKKAEHEIKLKNDELRKLNLQKDKFFSIIAHDLKSPFNSFLGITELLATDVREMTLDEIQKLVTSMHKSASQLYQLLENLLNWTRMQQGSKSFEPEWLSLSCFVNDYFQIAIETAKNKGITISFDIPEELQVYADANMLDSILRNLTMNAIKYSHSGDTIKLSARLNGITVDVSVNDTGIGMNSEMIGNLFQFDVNTCRPGTNHEPSTGLGILLCQEFVEKHGGQIWVESDEGKGSTFWFSLPVGE